VWAAIKHKGVRNGGVVWAAMKHKGVRRRSCLGYYEAQGC
jgi:hypothetical protein